jgi:hypothetical protein
MEIAKYTTDIINVTIASGANSGSTQNVTLEPGRIVGCALITNGVTNAGMVRLKLTNNGADVIKLQPISVLAQRDAAFKDSFYPIELMGGSSQLKLDIIAEANFAANFSADLVFFYEQNC